MLSNSYKKLTEQKKLNVGYLGGSITVGIGASNRDTTSWRALTTSWLKNQYRDAKINEINVSSGSTGSLYGAGRVKEQLLSGNPDLIFIEYAVNDHYQDYTQEESIRYMESIVRTTRKNNPYTDIVFVYTTHNGFRGNKTKWIEAFDKVAERYNILTVDVGAMLRDKIGYEYSSDWNANGTYLSDSVHPNDTGYATYASFVQDFLRTNLVDATAIVPYGMPETLSDNLLLDCDFYTPEEILQANEGKGTVQDTSFLLNKTEGTSISVRFTGTCVGMAWQLRTSNDVISVSIDGGNPIALNNINRDGTQRLLFDNLPNTEHTLTVTCNATFEEVFNIYGIFSANFSE